MIGASVDAPLLAWRDRRCRGGGFTRTSKANSRRFTGLFTTVAKHHKAALVPFLLKGVADIDDPARMFQADRIHPLASAHPQMLANVWPELKQLLK